MLGKRISHSWLCRRNDLSIIIWQIHTCTIVPITSSSRARTEEGEARQGSRLCQRPIWMNGTQDKKDISGDSLRRRATAWWSALGYAINPAGDLGSRMLTAMVGQERYAPSGSKSHLSARLNRIWSSVHQSVLDSLSSYGTIPWSSVCDDSLWSVPLQRTR